MAELGIVVEADLGIEHQQLAVVRDRERVDLDLRSVGADERIVELRHQLAGLLGEVAGQAERRSNGASMVRLQAGRRIDRQGLDLLRRVMGHLLDVHAALGRGDDRDAACLAVDQQREVEFLRDVDAVGDVEALDLLALRAGLDGDQRLAEHLLGIGAHFLDRLGEADAALGIGAKLRELALAAAAGVDLRLHDPERPGQLLRGLDRLVDIHCRMARRNRHAELRKQLFGLIFVDVHRGPPLSRMPARMQRPRPANVPNVRSNGGHSGRWLSARFRPRSIC